MKQIKTNDFYNFNFLGHINYSPKGDKAVVVNKEVDVKNNDYKSFLYLYKSCDSSNARVSSSILFSSR